MWRFVGKNTMNKNQLERLINKIKAAVHIFLANDGELLSLAGGVHEQTISHRIAVYLECLFKGYHVDCEYNKHLKASKKFNLNSLRPDEHRKCDCEACKKIVDNQLLQIKERLFRPDIIIHRRGGDENNNIAIEVKKKNDCQFDQAKLKTLTLSKENDGEYGYNLGIFIYFPDNEPKYKWFIDGIEI